jgi:hypothetical protein
VCKSLCETDILLVRRQFIMVEVNARNRLTNNNDHKWLFIAILNDTLLLLSSLVERLHNTL